MFHRINIADYKQSLIIDAWHIGKIETEPFTHITGFDEPEEGVEKDSEVPRIFHLRWCLQSGVARFAQVVIQRT